MLKQKELHRTEEVIAPSLDRRLIFAYLQTCYRVLSEPPFDLRVGDRHDDFDQFLEKFSASRWAFITPENPRSQLLPADENARRTQIFLEKIRSLGFQFFEGLGIGTDDWRPERSFLILKISRAAAVELASEFEQNAIVFGERNAAAELIFTVDQAIAAKASSNFGCKN